MNIEHNVSFGISHLEFWNWWDAVKSHLHLVSIKIYFNGKKNSSKNYIDKKSRVKNIHYRAGVLFIDNYLVVELN